MKPTFSRTLHGAQKNAQNPNPRHAHAPEPPRTGALYVEAMSIAGWRDRGSQDGAGANSALQKQNARKTRATHAVRLVAATMHTLRTVPRPKTASTTGRARKTRLLKEILLLLPCFLLLASRQTPPTALTVAATVRRE